MTRTICRLLIISMLIAPLSGCFGSKKKRNPPPDVATPAPPPAPTPPPTGGARFEDQFGTVFGTFFRAAAWSEPADPKPGDVVPVSLDRDPVNF